MKNIILITFLLLSYLGINAQTLKTVEKESYNKWAISADYGLHMIADKSATNRTYFSGIGGDIRYNFNSKFGIGMSGGLDIMKLYDFDNNPIDVNYTRFNFETYVNALNMVDVYSGKFAAIFHGGPGISFINTNNVYNQAIPNVRGGVSFLFKVSKKISIKTDMSVTANYATEMTLDGSYNKSNTGVNSMIANASIGLSYSLGKNKKHIDYYKPQYIEPTVTYITNNKSDTTIVKNYYYNNTIKKSNLIDTTQYVFFENDKYVIRDSELNAIFKTFVNLQNNQEYKLEIKGFASPSNDLALKVNSDDYNLNLSEKRADVIKQKFIDMGIPESKIKISFYGKDKKFPKETIFDAARRVELIISTK